MNVLRSFVLMVLLVALSTEVLAHNTPHITSADPNHVDRKWWHDSAQEAAKNREHGISHHWHFWKRGAASWSRCAALSYNEETDEYHYPTQQRCESRQRQQASVSIATASIGASTNVVQDADCEGHVWDFNISPIVGIPMLPEGVESIGNLRNYIGRQTRDYPNIGMLEDGRWRWVRRGENWDFELRDMEITPHLAIYVASRKQVCLTGESVGLGIVELSRENTSVHLIGFPATPTNHPNYSDLLIDGVRHVRWYYRDENGNKKTRTVSSARMQYDKPVMSGDAAQIIISKDVTFNFSGTSAAPQAHRTIAIGWGTVKSGVNLERK